MIKWIRTSKELSLSGQSHDAVQKMLVSLPVQIITMTQWIRTSRLSIKNSLSGQGHEAVQKMLVSMGDKEFKLPWREAGPPNHHDDKVDSDQ